MLSKSITLGSPPQVRGKLPPCARCWHRKRITPAGAGKTRRRNARNNKIQDHPRRCGENQQQEPAPEWGGGSPPQVRGKLFCHSLISSAYRITPAGAGKTLQPFRTSNLFWDHPRRCGENRLRGAAAAAASGSPPQVRGKLVATAQFHRQFGITPAGAGKTIGGLRNENYHEDHPRRCGENT